MEFSFNLYIPTPYNYKGYHAANKNGIGYEIVNGVQNRISLELPDGCMGNIDIVFRDPVYWTIALMISAEGVLILLLIIIQIGSDGKRISRSYTRI